MTKKQYLLRKRPSIGLVELLTRNGYHTPSNAYDAICIARVILNRGQASWVNSFYKSRET
jgi:hypothetical protein